MGEIYFCDFSSADLRHSYADILHRVRARDCDTTVMGGRRILVLFVRRVAVVDRFLRSAASNFDLRVRARAYARAMGMADGRAG